MDSDRCAALHNAIYEHGWINSGRTAESFTEQTTTLWEHLDAEMREKLHPSLQAFLREARTLLGYGQHTNFFYNVRGLMIAFNKDWYDPDPNRLLTLYGTYMAMATKLDGLVYDQHLHLATMNFDGPDDLELYPAQPWRKLEDILSVWIEMVQRSKIRSVPSAGTEMTPWKAVSWTAQDLEECVELWGMIVETVERKMELEKTEALVGLLDAATLDAARVPAEGFAQNFILQARKPRFKFVTPGLRIPTAEEFIDQPFTFAPKPQGLNPGDIPPILMFRADGLVNTADLAGFHYPYTGSAAIVQECPCGLYIDHCDPEMPLPFEDGCRLVLPFKLDGGFAKQGDSTNVEGYDTILQMGLNPYNVRHPLPFQAWLESVYHNIEDGKWAVDAHGVAGGIDLWKQADTEDGWQDYFTSPGPGGYW
ncbi:hypothetical protein LTR91_020214 [Friedmanniomyces endolithicus]|uniref:Uncharacterized protein n=1 Tax=Friedmanniomyces endolithicus TaxID=329885 RepID=A0AAN6K0Q6_9PEZI|nr:hypothetical protein LTR94_005992 [Friedmanniomyces endolithicus]KAK0789516.1 hypothetical protein LTR59_009586 [Friedmanniomyces endolithicus]KAK0797107.1 hypothetical protein LTR75_009955 [Friedmanniomyces endolithicus]KAK0803657.1 hypothetical protein LTR38_006048 [Friedmanniomyces endolithicus]KAK0848760.1 hypothetical protein LTR03_005548 [Friedmanniomyces endolithicus]